MKKREDLEDRNHTCPKWSGDQPAQTGVKSSYYQLRHTRSPARRGRTETLPVLSPASQSSLPLKGEIWIFSMTSKQVPGVLTASSHFLCFLQSTTCILLFSCCCCCFFCNMSKLNSVKINQVSQGSKVCSLTWKKWRPCFATLRETHTRERRDLGEHHAGEW